MKHHQYNSGYKFIKEPVDFNKYTDRQLLQYCLGATMYMPGTKDFAQAIIDKKYPGLTSMVMCFEDACKEEDVPAAEVNSIHVLDTLVESVEKGILKYEDIPLIFFRVRSVEQFKHFAAMLKPEHIKFLCGFNFPKFNSITAAPYMEHLVELNEKFGEVIYGMPIIEDARVAEISYGIQVAQMMLQKQASNETVYAKDNMIKGAASAVINSLNEFERQGI